MSLLEDQPANAKRRTDSSSGAIKEVFAVAGKKTGDEEDISLQRIEMVGLDAGIPGEGCVSR